MPAKVATTIKKVIFKDIALVTSYKPIANEGALERKDKAKGKKAFKSAAIIINSSTKDDNDENGNNNAQPKTNSSPLYSAQQRREEYSKAAKDSEIATFFRYSTKLSLFAKVSAEDYNYYNNAKEEFKEVIRLTDKDVASYI